VGNSNKKVHTVERRFIMALRGPTSTRQGYKVPTAPAKEEVEEVVKPKKEAKKPKKKGGLFSSKKK
jgi:hypothetical protein